MNPTKIDGLETRIAGDEVLVHDTAHGKVHVLNAVAGRILELCDGIHTVPEIARQISDLTGAEPVVVERDLAAVLHDFASLGLLEAVKP